MQLLVFSTWNWNCGWPEKLKSLVHSKSELDLCSAILLLQFRLPSYHFHFPLDSFCKSLIDYNRMFSQSVKLQPINYFKTFVHRIPFYANIPIHMYIHTYILTH